MPALKKLPGRPPLLPDRHPQLDFFVCDIFDAAPKSDTASMEYPLFSLSTKPDFKPREYRNGNMWLKLSPSPIGLATVHDRDILIFCISQCMAALKEGRQISRVLRFRAHELLQVTNRSTGKRGYDLFTDSLRRLQGTQIETNITTGGREQMDIFSFIDHARTVKETRDGRMEAMEITLSDWLFNAISERGNEILTISRDYFRLRKPLERRLYELARKHCGTNAMWRFRVETLHERTGSSASLPEFRRMLAGIIENSQAYDHIPDYTFELSDDTVTIRPRQEFLDVYEQPQKPSAIDKIRLKPQTYETARKFAGGYDMYMLEDEWRYMLAKKGEMPQTPDGSFVGFVKWYVDEHGPAR
jgi:plasmid replication initiation protein